MANPQKKKGFTQMGNDIMEALARIRIPGESRQVLDVIIRKTCGFHKKEDMISLSQFHLATGIKKPSIIRAIKLLRSMNLIYKKTKGWIASYKINTDIWSWKPLAKKLTVSKKANECLQKSKSAFTKKLPTKETITKETITKEIYSLNSDEFTLSNLLLTHILKRNPNHKKPDLQKWASHIDKMIRLDNRSVEEIRKVIDWCQREGCFWQNVILGTNKLREKFDQLKLQMEVDNAKHEGNSKFTKLSEKDYHEGTF